MLESCHALLQGIFPTQELNPILCLLHWKVGSLPLESESEVSQSCPTLGDLMDCSLPGSSLHGILQATVLEWVASTFPSPGDLPLGAPEKPFGLVVSFFFFFTFLNFLFRNEV